jgi:hypothetical protein
VTAGLTRFRQARGVLSRSFGGEVILAPSDREEFESLSRTAADVWSLLAQPRSLGDIVRSLEDAYAAPGTRIARDVEPLISDLADRGLIERVQGGDG